MAGDGEVSTFNGRSAYDIISARITEPGRYFGPAGKLSTGVGLFLRNAPYATYSRDEEDYVVVDGLVYVLTHECDISEENDRPFNDFAVVCPITPLELVAEEYVARFNADKAQQFFDALAQEAIERVVYVPPIADVLPLGGVMYFGLLSSIHVSELLRDTVERCGALTVFGLSVIDRAVQRAFLRPKSEELALAR